MTNNNNHRRLIPIYTTSGDLGAYMLYPHIYNPIGEWIGWITPQKEIYSVMGSYVGFLSDGPRVLRPRSYDFSKPRVEPGPPQPRIRVPASAPLPPMMSELAFTYIDVLEDEPEKLSTFDHHDLREDMD